MKYPEYENNDNSWNINKLFEGENENEFDDDENYFSGEREITPQLDDDIFNESHSARGIELF